MGVVLWIGEEALDLGFSVDVTPPLLHTQCSLLPWDGAVSRGWSFIIREVLSPKHPDLKPREQIGL